MEREEEAALWQAYLAGRDAVLRGRLIERYLPEVHRIAAHAYARRGPQAPEFDDYLQWARLGLSGPPRPAAQRPAPPASARRGPQAPEFADSLQWARLGLIEAFDRYEPAREASFMTFAEIGRASCRERV